MTPLAYLILFTSVVLAGFGVFVAGNDNKKYLKLALSFSGAYLFAITLTHLVPEVYERASAKAGLFMLAGFFFQIILEFFSEGIEHGHIHVHKHKHPVLPISVMFSLCLHSFLEGMPLAQNSSAGTSLLTGIILHHLPVAFALMSLLLESGIKKNVSIGLLVLFALMTPLGAIMGSEIYSGTITPESLIPESVMAFVIGIFLHISTTILFESSEDHRFNFIKLIMMLIGVGAACISFL